MPGIAVSRGDVRAGGQVQLSSSGDVRQRRAREKSGRKSVEQRAVRQAAGRALRAPARWMTYQQARVGVE
jgi:hypothetical protein